MRRTKALLLLGTGVGLALAAGPAPAQDSISQALRELDSNEDGKLQRSETPVEFLSRFREIDRDRDGGIDSFEAWEYEARLRRREAAEASRREPPPRSEPAPAKTPQTLVELIEMGDPNGDGRLAADEVPPAMRERFRQLDLDGDGFFDLEEARSLDARRTQAETRTGRRTFVRIVGLMDTDGDGLLQKKEAPLRVQAVFEQLDRNGDGALDLEEARAADAETVNPEAAR